MIDSGATGNFMDHDAVLDNGFKLVKKVQPYRLFVIDGSSIGSNKGTVTLQTDRMTMKTLRGHTEDIEFDVTSLGSHKLVLGMPWLALHNPTIDWWTERITMNHCTCGSDRSTLDRPDRKPKQEQINATVLTNEDHAQASSLMRIPAEYKEYEHLFREKPTNETLPKHQPWDHEIPLEPGKVPGWGPIYQQSAAELQHLKEYIDENLKKGFIRPSTSSAASPTLYVPKKDGPDRLCIDYRNLNSITVKDRYPLPLINELHDRLEGAKFFTSLDLRGAYNLVRMKEGEEWKTAFRTRYGLYEYLVMPFGLTNAPATFQRMINEQLHEYLDVFVVAYLDDILVYSKTKNDHIQHIKKVMDKLQKANLLLKLEKCKFHQEEVAFLGFIVGRHGIRMNPDKVDAVLTWPVPGTVVQVQSFLGFANFYRRFIKNYSAIAKPLTELTKKDKDFEWSTAEQAAFDQLKKRFTEEPVLATYDPELETVLETDASDFALGACISQKHSGQLRPIAYHSRTFSPAELNYDVHDKELLAIVAACKQWRHYLEGAKHVIQVWTDHKNLTSFTTTKILNRRQVRWSEELSTLKLFITYRKGSENARADALSRRQDYSGKPTERPRAILKETQGGLEYNHELLATLAVLEDNELAQQIKAAYPRDECAARVLATQTQDFTVDNDGILRFKGLVYIPSRMRKTFVEQQHSLPAHGHQGLSRTFDRISRDYYFPSMRKEVYEVLRGCDLCAKSKSERHAPYGLLQPPSVSTRAWESIAFDFIVKLPPSKEPMTSAVFDAIWVITDRNTKYGYFVPYKESSNAKELAYAFLKVVVSQHGLPKEIISDRDKLFTSKFWSSLMNQLGLNHKMSTAFHPQTDGQTERLNQTLEQYLRSYVNKEQDNWVELLPIAQFALNSAKNETTSVSPFFANYGFEPEAYRQPRQDNISAQESMVLANRLKDLQQQLAADIEFSNSRTAKYSNKKRSVGPPLQRGDKVYLLRKHIKTKRPSTKLDFKKLGPFEILEQVGKVNFRLRLPKGSRLHPVFHVSLLEPARGTTPLATNEELQPENDPDVYEVEKLMDTRKGPKGQQEYLVKWKGYGDEESTWEHTRNLNCPDLVRQFQSRNQANPRRPQQTQWMPRTTRGGRPEPPDR